MLPAEKRLTAKRYSFQD